jgi:DNA-nicking Smr family endonuclease
MSQKRAPEGFNNPFAKLTLPSAKAGGAAAPGKAPGAPSGPTPGPASLARSAAVSPPKQAARSQKDEEDQRAFAQAMAGVVPLDATARTQRRPASDSPPPLALATLRARAATEDALARADLADLVQAHGAFTIEEVGEAVAALAPGIDRKLLRRLRDGDFPVEGELDLHRRSRAVAAAELERFLNAARAAGQRCVLIIHGRGLGSGVEGPVLPAATRAWLTEKPLRRHVLAFASAPPERGGTGALLVLLRRQGT